MSLLRRLRRDTGPDESPSSAPSDDAPRPEELVFRGGTWNGLLFDNPTIGLLPALTWTFSFRFDEVVRDHGTSPVGFTVDWVPLPNTDWTTMAGKNAVCEIFAEPIECSAYFFEHYRYDVVDLRLVEQNGGNLRVVANAHGDVDGLGVPEWNVDQQLAFEGIYVALSDVEDLDAATTRLANFTDASGLIGVKSGNSFLFADRADS